MYAQPFLINPDNAAFLAHTSSHVDRSTRTPLFIALFVCTVLSALFLFGAWSSWDTETRFAAKGVNTQGTITDSRSSRGTRTTSYYVTYQFRVPNTIQGALFTNEVDVDSDTYNSAYEGKPVTVRYLSDDPTQSELAGQSSIPSVVTWLVLGFVMLAFTVFVVSRVRRLRRFERNGRILPATLVTHAFTTSRTRGRPTLYLSLHFRFRSPTGAEITGSKTAPRNDLKAQPITLQPGVPLAVLYLDDTHYMLL